jgi:hypothetical protein
VLCVCGCLKIQKYLAPLTKSRVDMTPLDVFGVTQKECLLATDDIVDLSDLVLDMTCKHMCVECEIILAKKKNTRCCISKALLVRGCCASATRP